MRHFKIISNHAAMNLNDTHAIWHGVYLSISSIYVIQLYNITYIITYMMLSTRSNLELPKLSKTGIW